MAKARYIVGVRSWTNNDSWPSRTFMEPTVLRVPEGAAIPLVKRAAKLCDVRILLSFTGDIQVNTGEVEDMSWMLLDKLPDLARNDMNVLVELCGKSAVVARLQEMLGGVIGSIGDDEETLRRELDMAEVNLRRSILEHERNAQAKVEASKQHAALLSSMIAALSE